MNYRTEIIRVMVEEEVLAPPVDIYEAGGALVIEMDLPGIGLEDIRIKVSSGCLVIEGEKKETGRTERPRYICMERSFKCFRRAIQFPVPVEEKGGKAAYINGVLTVRFPKKQNLSAEEVKIAIERQ
ncbi:MAG: Hsp20/alpha crystallin family protein [Nitrospiraceae bacterium]|nr:Hsp20/alpha crystallin family protein [Nitrospiraceae bacterium]